MIVPLLYNDRESEQQEIIGVMLVSVSTDNIEANLEYLRSRALIFQVVDALVLFAVGVWLAVKDCKTFKTDVGVY